MMHVGWNSRYAMLVVWGAVLAWGTGPTAAWGQEPTEPEPNQKDAQAEPQRWPRIEVEPKSLSVGEVFVGDEGKSEISSRKFQLFTMEH